MFHDRQLLQESEDSIRITHKRSQCTQNSREKALTRHFAFFEKKCYYKIIMEIYKNAFFGGYIMQKYVAILSFALSFLTATLAAEPCSSMQQVQKQISALNTQISQLKQKRSQLGGERYAKRIKQYNDSLATLPQRIEKQKNDIFEEIKCYGSTSNDRYHLLQALKTSKITLLDSSYPGSQRAETAQKTFKQFDCYIKKCVESIDYEQLTFEQIRFVKKYAKFKGLDDLYLGTEKEIRIVDYKHDSQRIRKTCQLIKTLYTKFHEVVTEEQEINMLIHMNIQSLEHHTKHNASRFQEVKNQIQSLEEQYEILKTKQELIRKQKEQAEKLKQIERTAKQHKKNTLQELKKQADAKKKSAKKALKEAIKNKIKQRYFRKQFSNKAQTIQVEIALLNNFEQSTKTLGINLFKHAKTVIEFFWELACIDYLQEYERVEKINDDLKKDVIEGLRKLISLNKAYLSQQKVRELITENNLLKNAEKREQLLQELFRPNKPISLFNKIYSLFG